MKYFILLFSALMMSSATYAANAPKTRSLKHISNINKRPDGQYDILCMDGVIQVKSEKDILSNDVCEHILEKTNTWKQTNEGPDIGVRFCEFKTSTSEINAVISYLSVKFQEPCDQTPILANSCSGKICTLYIGPNEYSFDLSQAPYTLEVTRLSDNFKFRFQ